MHPRLTHYDFSFDPPSPFGGYPLGIAIQMNGQIIVRTVIGVTRYLPNGHIDRTFTFTRRTYAVTGLAVDNLDHIYVAEEDTLSVFSGQYRIKGDAPTVPVTLQRSSLIDSGWTPVKTFPANVQIDYPDPNYPGVGNTFYRTKSVE
jgi:hypothetical protein